MYITSNLASLAFTSQWDTEVDEIKPNIFIPSETVDPNFNMDIRPIIEQVETNHVGRRLLEKISTCASKVYIGYGEKDECTHAQTQKSKEAGLILPAIISLSMKELRCFSPQGEPISMPPHVTLFHELTHAYHNLSGKRANSSYFCDPIIWENSEEYKTIVGFPSKNKERTRSKITENAFRREEGLPERFSHFSSSGSDLRQTLCALRTQVLGKIHLRNQEMFPLNLSPPPIALCSINDLGPGNHCLFLFNIQGVHQKLAKTEYLMLDDQGNHFGSAMGDQCYFSVNPEPFLAWMTKMLTEGFPKLVGIDFTIKSCTLLRVSQDERDVVLKMSDSTS